MMNEFMSSEESGTDDGHEVVITKPLPWRSQYCSTMFKRIDDYVDRHRSSQAKRQMKRRHISKSPSSRNKPEGTSVPDWAII